MASLERELHRWLESELSDSVRPSVLIGVGDDAAVLAGSNDRTVVTTDTIADGTHFQTERHSLDRIGRKSLAVNLSDIAAMGAEPTGVVLHWMLPKHFSLDDAKILFRGIKELADQYDVAIIGGDTNRWDGKLVVGATAFGTLLPDHRPWQINSASPGDAIFVSGQFGGSILGHHLDFQPDIDLARALAGHAGVTAATDASDSLTSDLHAMATASNCGAVLELDCIPIAEAAFSLAKKELDETELDETTNPHAVAARALEHALGDGEDFGLILAVAPGHLPEVSGLPKLLTKIGTFCERSGLWATQPGGALEPIEAAGYDH